MADSPVSQAQRIIPVQTLTSKIGTLSVQNDFLSEEIERVGKLYVGLKGELAAEIARIEADIEKEEEAVKSVAKSVIARIKTKLL